jgi:hypothetical protein
MITGIERLAAEGHTEYPRRDLELLAAHPGRVAGNGYFPLVR